MSHLNFNMHVAQCPLLFDPPNGLVTATGQSNGSTAIYTCDSGFELLDLSSGGDVRTCQPDGLWSGSEQQCVCKCCCDTKFHLHGPSHQLALELLNLCGAKVHFYLI